MLTATDWLFLSPRFLRAFLNDDDLHCYGLTPFRSLTDWLSAEPSRTERPDFCSHRWTKKRRENRFPPFKTFVLTKTCFHDGAASSSSSSTWTANRAAKRRWSRRHESRLPLLNVCLSNGSRQTGSWSRSRFRVTARHLRQRTLTTGGSMTVTLVSCVLSYKDIFSINYATLVFKHSDWLIQRFNQ